MKHFLTKLIQGEADQSVHRRFIKFSKGEFPNGGPVLRAKATKKNTMAVNSSFEYEDLLGYFLASNLPDDTYKVGGNIYTQPRVELDWIQNELEELSLSSGWEKGKRDLKKLMVYPMDLNLSPDEITQIFEKLSTNCYLLLTINPEKGKEWVFKAAEKIPPLKKTFGKADPYSECKPDKRIKCKNAELCQKTGICITERTKFCRIKTGYLEEFAEFFELVIPDFPQLHQSFTELLVINQYTINKLVFPEDRDSLSPQELREKIKKAGFVERIVYVDNKIQSKKVDFIV
ncbi:MAG: hypothetical protein HWN65_13160 [Candidatus Helarchaeota archaeon]|nr:hypothetical protein [Candidatus Helarchaeota archaeon]